MKSIKLGKYTLHFNIVKNPPKRITMPEIIAKVLNEDDIHRKNNQRLKASSEEYALKYERLLNNVATRITREPGSAFKIKTIIEKEIKPQEVYNKMEELIANDDTPLENRRGRQI
jgi:hypothetical protein